MPQMEDEIFKRLKEGASDQELTDEFKLTAEQLNTVVDMLVGSSVMTSDELKTIRKSANWDSANFRPELESGTPDRQESKEDFDEEEKRRKRVSRIFYVALCFIIGSAVLFLLKNYSVETIYKMIQSCVVDPFRVVKSHGEKYLGTRKMYGGLSKEACFFAGRAVDIFGLRSKVYVPTW